MKNLSCVLFLSLGMGLSAQATVVELSAAPAILCHQGAVSERFTYEQSHNTVNGVKDRHGLITARVRGAGRGSSRLTYVIRGLWWNRGFSEVRAYDANGRYVNTCATQGPFGLQLHTDRCRPVMRVVPIAPVADECGEGNPTYLLETKLLVQDGA